jgi:DNA invertase Pin-like site-specific DNA recombinase
MTTIRAALYARYSTDQQRQTSLADQLRAARERAAREGWQIVAEHADEAVSGSVPVALRPGGKALLADALAGRFDVLVLEGLDRLSREVGESEAIVKRMEHRGIRIVGTADGYDSQAQGRKVMRIARGLISELYLDDLRAKTHRGLAGQFGRGYHVGGICFGYRSQATADGRGRELVIDEAQASVVRRIFGDFAAGHSARGIAHALNAESVASPRGGTWAVSALVGDSRRGAGILNNELYAGRLIWNRRQWLKDPETGARRYVDRPRAEWQVREVPELRIVPAELWQAVRERQRTGPARGTRTGRGASPRTLFAGLLRCAACGGPIVSIDARRYGCSRHADRGAAVCASGEAWPRSAVDQVLLTVVREELLSPAALAEMHQAVRELQRARQPRKDAAPARLAALQREIERLVDAVAQVGLSDALRARLAAAEAERLALLTQAPPPVEALPDARALLAAYRRQMLDLRQALESEQDRDRTRALLAGMLGPVTLLRDDAGDWAEMEEPAARVALAGSPVGVVAGACNGYRRRVLICR